MIDPTGQLITLLRDAAAVQALVPTDPHGHRKVRGTERERGWKPPFVVVRRLPSVPWVGSPATEDAGVGTFRYAVLCYADRAVEDATTGERYPDDAPNYALAGAVHDAVSGRGPITFTTGGERAVIHRIQSDGDGPVLVDPDTKERYVPVQLTVLAATVPLS